MHEHRDAVGGQRDIDLDVVEARVQSRFDGGQRVLGCERSTAAVTHDEGSIVGRARVAEHLGRAHSGRARPEEGDDEARDSEHADRGHPVTAQHQEVEDVPDADGRIARPHLDVESRRVDTALHLELGGG